MNTMYPAMVNSPETVTMGAIAADTTTVTVQDITKIPDAPNLLVLGGERPDAETVLMTAVNENMITIQRGVQGTARAWADATTIARNFTAYDYDTLRTNLLELNTTKANRPDQFTSGNFAVLDANGNPSDSGENPNDYAPAMLTETVTGHGQELQTLSAQAQQQSAEIAGKANKSTAATVILTTAGWADNQQTLSVDGATSTNIIEIAVDKTATLEQEAEFYAAALKDGGQADGTITLNVSGKIPSVDIPILVISRGDL